MILFRYMAREVLATMISAAGIVLVISMGWRFSGYLDDAAAGLLSKDVLFLIMAYRLPGFLELIMPVALFLAIMLSYGRMYVDSEMVVLESCGIGPHRIVYLTAALALPVMVATGVLSLWLKPAGEDGVHNLLQNQKNLTEFDTLAPGRFQSLASGRRVTYVEDFTDDRALQNVFMNEYVDSPRFQPKEVVTLVAEAGETQVDDRENRFLVLKDGFRYGMRPGSRELQVIQYEEYGQLLPREDNIVASVRQEAVPTRQLIGSADLGDQGELQWRVSVVLMIPIIAVMAVPLARVNPRQGRFTRLVPGMILCLLYVIALSTARSSVQKGDLPPMPGIYWIHVLFIAITIGLFRMDFIRTLVAGLKPGRAAA